MLELKQVNPQEYRELYKHMRRDFPANELPPYYAVKRSLKKGIYDGVYIVQTEEPKICGYAITTAPAGLDFALINFLAILPEIRSKGYGSALLSLLNIRYENRILTVEVDSPKAASTPENKQICERRIAFYQKSGFRVIPTEKVTIFGVEMEIMMNTTQPIESVKKVMHDLYLPSLGSKMWLRFIHVIDCVQ